MKLFQLLRQRWQQLFGGTALAVAAGSASAQAIDITGAVSTITDNQANIVTYGVAVIAALAIVKILNIIKTA